MQHLAALAFWKTSAMRSTGFLLMLCAFGSHSPEVFALFRGKMEARRDPGKPLLRLEGF